MGETRGPAHRSRPPITNVSAVLEGEGEIASTKVGEGRGGVVVDVAAAPSEAFKGPHAFGDKAGGDFSGPCRFHFFGSDIERGRCIYDNDTSIDSIRQAFNHSRLK